MAEERSDTAHNIDDAATAASADRAASPGASDATFTTESAEAIPGFRESLQRALKLFVRRHKGEYKLDFDWTLSRLERNMERPATLLDAIAVRMVCDAAYGSHRAWKELLDRLEGSVAQRHEFDFRRAAERTAESLGVPVEELLEEARQIAGRPN